VEVGDAFPQPCQVFSLITSLQSTLRFVAGSLKSVAKFLR